MPTIVKFKSFFRGQQGQAMTEYIIVCMLVAMVLIIPYEGKRLYLWIVDALRAMHINYMAGLSVYAYPF